MWRPRMRTGRIPRGPCRRRRLNSRGARSLGSIIWLGSRPTEAWVEAGIRGGKKSTTGKAELPRQTRASTDEARSSDQCQTWVRKVLRRSGLPVLTSVTVREHRHEVPVAGLNLVHQRPSSPRQRRCTVQERETRRAPSSTTTTMTPGMLLSRVGCTLAELAPSAGGHLP